jgi:ELWxxDGT repeat protein
MPSSSVVRAAFALGPLLLIIIVYSHYQERHRPSDKQASLQPVTRLADRLASSNFDQEFQDWIATCSHDPFGTEKLQPLPGEKLYQEYLADVDEKLNAVLDSNSLDQLLGPNSQLSTRLATFRTWVAKERTQQNFFACATEQTPDKLKWLQQVEGTYTFCLNQLWQRGPDGQATPKRPDMAECLKRLTALPALDQQPVPSRPLNSGAMRDYVIPVAKSLVTDTVLEIPVDARPDRRAAFVLSPDAASMAVVIKRGDRQLVVVDGREGAPYEEIRGAPVFSADSRHVAYTASKGGMAVLVADGVEGRAYEKILNVAFGQTGARLAYVASRDERWWIIVDGQEQPADGPPNEAVVFSPSAARVAYVTGHNPQSIVLDGRMGPAYDAIPDPGPVFSPDSSHCAYIAKRGAQQVVVLDGKESAPYDQIGALIFSPDSARYAYSAQRGAQHFVIVDGRESPAYDLVIEPGPVFSADSKHVGYAATTNAKARIVIDGNDGPGYDEIAKGSAVFSRDSKRTAYVARSGQKVLAVIDGREGPEYERISGNVVFSPDSTREAYVATNEHSAHVVVNGVEGPAYEEVFAPGPLFSPDSNHLAFVVRLGTQRAVVNDGRVQHPYYTLDEDSLRFSPDSAHLAYAAWRTGWHLVVDGFESSNAVAAFGDATAPVFQTSARVQAVGRAAGDRELVRLVTVIKSGADPDGQLDPEADGQLPLEADPARLLPASLRVVRKSPFVEIDEILSVDGTAFFTASGEKTAGALWKTNGTAAGTVPVTNAKRNDDFEDDPSRILPANPYALTNVNGTLFFAARRRGRGVELWKRDPLAPVPTLVKDIYPGIGSSAPSALTNVNGVLFFVADDGLHGRELWKSDGTAQGTVLVRDINPDLDDSNPSELTAVNSTLFFIANDGQTGPELWKSDGTAAGTVRVKDILPGREGRVSHLSRLNGMLLFAADDGRSGTELWKSNGTEGGTVLLKDINPGPADSSPAEFREMSGVLYFAAHDGTRGIELWKTDGTAAGTVLVKDINPGHPSSSPCLLTNVSGTLFFWADDGITGKELWKSDGTAAGTVLVKDINPGKGTSFPVFSSTGTTFYHPVTTPKGPSIMVAINHTLYFTADEDHGKELWKSDGTAAGTVLVKDINPAKNSSAPSLLTNLNGVLLFAADDGRSGVGLWKSDGTAAGTMPVGQNTDPNRPAGEYVVRYP